MSDTTMALVEHSALPGFRQLDMGNVGFVKCAAAFRRREKKEAAEMLKKYVTVGFMVVVIVASLIGGSVGVVFAEGNEKASCIGLDASANAPVNEQIAGIKVIVGIPFGALVSSVAQLHLGTDEACLAAGG